VRRVGKASTMWLVGLALLVPNTASAAVAYRATAIGPASSYTELGDVSDTGVVVGYVATGTERRAIAWLNGYTKTLPDLPNGKGASALGISLTGDYIVGVDVVSRHSHAVLWHNSTVKDLGMLPGGDFSDAYAVNDQGMVVGIAGLANCPPSSGCWHAVIWGRRGVIHDLGTLKGDVKSTAMAINDDGVIVGWSETSRRVERPVVWRHRQIHRLPTLGHVGEADINMASDINGHGTIVGTASAGRHYRGVFWRIGKIHRLESPSDTSTAASAINEHGAIVGTITRDNRIYHAAKWTPQERLIHLQRLLATPGWQLGSAAAINDHGWILGLGHLAGKERSYLLRPTTG